jgi:molybdate transport system substrate-binding protein
LLLHGGASLNAQESIVVYAAASTGNAISELARRFERTNPARIATSFASSSTLAKQIAAGSSADICISANRSWMDYLVEQDLLDPINRRDLLTNRLVLIAPLDSGLVVRMQKDFDFSGVFEGRLCMGDRSHVPASIYGKEALVAHGWWQPIQARVVSGKDVVAALNFVVRGECAAGIVYAIDAAASTKVRVIAVFPEASHSRIGYPAALLNSEIDGARAFFAYLFFENAAAVFERYGFGRASP